MRLLLVLLISIFGLTSVKAQLIYIPGDTVRGKKVSYYCTKRSDLVIQVRNTQNVDSLGKMYFDNGKVVPPSYLSSEYNFEFKEFIQAFKDALTREELNQLKGEIGFFQVNVVADKIGNALELEFVFFANDAVLSKFAPDRLFQLETKLKKLLKLKVSERDRKIKNLKYVISISFRKDL